jgi:hypothetical protein
MNIVFIPDFCCDFHVNASVEVKMECIQYLNELVDMILSHTAVGDVMSELSLM